MGESSWKSAQPTYRSLAKRPSSTTAYGGGPPSPEGKVWGGDASPEIIIAIASYFC